MGWGRWSGRDGSFLDRIVDRRIKTGDARVDRKRAWHKVSACGPMFNGKRILFSSVGGAYKVSVSVSGGTVKVTGNGVKMVVAVVVVVEVTVLMLVLRYELQ